MKICFWGDVAGALKGNTSGGGELQIALLATALTKAGHEVVVIDYLIDEDFVSPCGVKVIAIKEWNKGLRILRNFTHRLPGLFRSLKNQNADIYYCRIREYRHILAFWAAKKVNARFILALADGFDGANIFKRWKYDYLTKNGSLWWMLNVILTEIVYPYLIKRSDYVFTQHAGQKMILIRKNKNSVLFPNLFDPGEIPPVKNPVRKDFVYVGAISKNKGAIGLYELITRTPEISYKVIGRPRDKTGDLYYKKMESLPNVRLLGKLNHRDTLFLIENSKALISTSPFEGFPNVFIEAWACGIPVFSLYVDPGNIISENRLGGSAKGDIDKLISMIKEKDYDEFAQRTKEYVKQTHELNDKRINDIDILFRSLSKR